ncbi:ParD-like family protein [soil metagenome]
MAGLTSKMARVDADVLGDAEVAGGLMDRSVAKQISHWARIGREVEAATILSTHRRRIAAVVDGDGSGYDLLDADEQAHVRALWGARIDQAAAAVDVAAEKRASGLPYATVDDDGNPILVHPDGTTSAP